MCTCIEDGGLSDYTQFNNAICKFTRWIRDWKPVIVVKKSLSTPACVQWFLRTAFPKLKISQIPQTDLLSDNKIICTQVRFRDILKYNIQMIDQPVQTCFQDLERLVEKLFLRSRSILHFRHCRGIGFLVLNVDPQLTRAIPYKSRVQWSFNALNITRYTSP